MIIGKLKLSDALSILHESTFGRLGCITKGEPYVIPINYYFDGKYIFSHSLPGRKIDAMRANPRVCLQVDQIRDPYHWRSAIAYGQYDEIVDPQKREKVMAELFKHIEQMTPVESKMIGTSEKMIVYRIKLTEITGVGEEW